MTNGKAKGADFLTVCVSSQGRYLYALGEDGFMYAFDLKLGQLEEVVDTKVRGQQAIQAVQVVHHPHRNLVAVVTRDGQARMLVA